ncbi:prenyltransferase/squalene oxidase repeat-containing protein [Streptomyces sp. NPDC085524]|uniref:prenyltransferase/squalene oxidase repeat-containing protein n=1 Tax=Streptomyces sp. NPDC085524 TaxID=3365728 RepID=UPI0037D225F9
MTALPLTTAPLVHAAVQRAARHLAAQVGTDGMLNAPCESRALESALAFRLLERQRVLPDMHTKLQAFLETVHRDTYAGTVDKLLASAALHHHAVPTSDPADQIISHFRHFTAGRKRLLVQAVLHALGALEAVTWPSRDLFDTTGLQLWKQAEMTACKVILAHALGRQEEITDKDLECLAATQRDGTIWQANTLSHLLVLTALDHLPGQHDTVRRGLAALPAIQRSDGGLSLTPDMDTTLTGMAAAALAAAASDPLLQRHLADRLVDLQQPAGSWTFTPQAAQTDVETTFFVLEALHLTEPARYADSLRRGCDYLCDMQNPDGGLNNYAQGGASEASHTGQALTIWAAHDPHRYASHIDRAARFVASQQEPDGSYALNWSASDANVILRTCHGLHTALAQGCLSLSAQEAARRAIDKSTRYLLTRQHEDGGWGQQPHHSSDPTSTAYALTTLTIVRPATQATARAAHYLCRTQRRDGGFHAPPDTYSPRPLVIDIKALPTIYALRALALTLHAP